MYYRHSTKSPIKILKRATKPMYGLPMRTRICPTIVPTTTSAAPRLPLIVVGSPHSLGSRSQMRRTLSATHPNRRSLCANVSLRYCKRNTTKSLAMCSSAGFLRELLWTRMKSGTASTAWRTSEKLDGRSSVKLPRMNKNAAKLATVSCPSLLLWQTLV